MYVWGRGFDRRLTISVPLILQCGSIPEFPELLRSNLHTVAAKHNSASRHDNVAAIAPSHRPVYGTCADGSSAYPGVPGNTTAVWKLGLLGLRPQD